MPPREDEADSNPLSYTLRLKHARQTILIITDPLTPFSSIKSTLLTILRERYPDGLPKTETSSPTPTPSFTYIPIPESINDVYLGVLVDPTDTESGWVELGVDQGDIKESPKSLGLVDGAVVAFAFVDGEADGEMEGAEVTFDVEWSSYEENYPDENGGAESGRGE